MRFVHIFSKKNRALLAELVRTDFKLRYQGSVLGYAWSLLRPLLLFLIIYIVFVNFLKIDDNTPHYPAYLLLGIVIWNFFNEITSQSLRSIVERGNLIRKIKIPRWIIIVSSSFSATINFLLNMLVIGVFLAIGKVGISVNILMLPLILIEIYLFSLGIALFLSALYVKYRDVGYIWEVVLQALFYATPIIYPLSKIASVPLLKLLTINPIAQSVQDARYVVVTNASKTVADVYGSPWARLIPLGITIVLFLTGLIYFRKESKYFAESI